MTARLPVFAFHDLAVQRSPASFPSELFRRGLERLHADGYATVDLAAALRALQCGERLPAKSFAIAFDDGYRSLYETALPVLERLDFRATVFVISGEDASQRSDRLPTFEGRELLRWGELRELVEAGFAIGSHTLTHPDLTRASPERVARELRDSRAILEDRLDTAVEGLAYPYGRLDANTREAARECYAYACSDRLGLVDQRSDVFAIERIDMSFFSRDGLFPILRSPALAWYLALRRLHLDVARSFFGDPAVRAGVRE